ncbi:helix-turn-helix domain-containing protein [Cereibacter sphaeroides]|uniref:helix-turn-helix transcriptional regulator n=1 Tax=Cereibacter sphaeroides TaxID=1063 RepID=UPI001F311F52|nr:helix-turn-helix domain-containing protein [Cereibacter sphaeroides]MCE6950128.1 helix-turn-helix domain-containing protein [Cereibacter sphaeroides]MCE6957965.1 helix-turn-helix domain-containing protein [Cereibacter sphaeroides]MCE6971772.1 helix-turn-helix domain-containing protein [Cereibacter sphaeroides]
MAFSPPQSEGLIETVAQIVARRVVEEILPVVTAKVPIEQPKYLTTDEAARITRLSRAALEAFRSKRQGPPYFKVGTNVRYRLDELRAWMESERIETNQMTKRK